MVVDVAIISSGLLNDDVIIQKKGKKKSKMDIHRTIKHSGGSRGYASSKEKGERAIKRSLSNSKK